MHWQEKQQELTNAFNRSQQQWQQGYTQQQARVGHEHYMVDHLANPILALLVVIIAGRVIWAIARASIDAGISKNHDDNQAEVVRAREIIEKHEANA